MYPHKASNLTLQKRMTRKVFLILLARKKTNFIRQNLLMTRMMRCQTDLMQLNPQVAHHNSVKSEQSIQIPKPSQLQIPHLHHALLAFEVTRLQEVIEQYEDNLQGLVRDIDSLNQENDELHDSNIQLRNELSDARMKLAIPPPPQQTVVKTVYVQEPTPAPQVMPQPIVAQPQPRPQMQIINTTDLLQDDKSALVNMLVKKNIENDHLRRELDFYKQRIDGSAPEDSRIFNLVQDGSKNGELMRSIGDLFTKYRLLDPEIEQKSKSVRNTAYKLAATMDPKARASHLEASFGPDGMIADIRDITANTPTAESYLIERQNLLNSLESLLSRLAAGPRASAEDVRRTEPSSPMREPQPQEEYRTEIINGIPTRVRVVRRLADQGERAGPRGEQGGQPQSQELQAALRRVSELERHVALLQGQADLRGPPAFGKEVGDLTVSLVQRDLQDWRLRAAALENELLLANRELEHELGRAKRLDSEKEDLLHRIKVFEGLYDEARVNCEKLRSQVRELEDQERNQGRSAMESRSMYESKARDLELAREEIADKKGRIAELEAKLRVALEEASEAKQKAKLIDMDAERSKEIITQLKNEIAERERSNASLKDEVKRLNDELSEMDNTLMIMKNKLLEKQAQVEAHASKDKDVVEQINSESSANKMLKDEIRQLQDILSKKDDEFKKKYFKQKEAYQQNLRHLMMSLGHIKEEVKSLYLHLKEYRLVSTREMIEYRKSFQAVNKMLRVQGEFNPKGTLQSLLEMKARHNEELPMMAMRLATYENILHRKDSEVMSNISEKDKEIESLEKQISAIRKEKDDADRAKEAVQAERAQENSRLKAKVADIEEQLETAVNDYVKIKKESERKDREISELKEDVEIERGRADDLKKTLRKMQSQQEKEETNPPKESPKRSQDFTIRTLQENTPTYSQSKGVRLTVDHRDGQLPAEVDIFIDASDHKPPRATTETRSTVFKKFSPEKNNLSSDGMTHIEQQLQEAFAQIRHYEHQLMLLNNKERQRETIGSRLSEVEASLVQLQVILKNKDLEIERLKSQLATYKGTPNGLSTEEVDRVEVLRQRTEAMLTKLERKLESMANKRGDRPDSQLEALVLEVQSLRKRLLDAGRRYVNEYISVCQRSLDIYEKL
jgi:chromosome segregation ATPase